MKLPVEAIGTREQVQNKEQNIESNYNGNIIMQSSQKQFYYLPKAKDGKIRVV